MGYCLDDLCHDGTPSCGATSAYHCTVSTVGSTTCPDPGCEVCHPDDGDDDPDGSDR